MRYAGFLSPLTDIGAEPPRMPVTDSRAELTLTLSLSAIKAEAICLASPLIVSATESVKPSIRKTALCICESGSAALTVTRLDGSIIPMRAESRTPIAAESRTPIAAESRTPIAAESRNPTRAESRSATRAESVSPTRAEAPREDSSAA